MGSKEDKVNRITKEILEKARAEMKRLGYDVDAPFDQSDETDEAKIKKMVDEDVSEIKKMFEKAGIPAGRVIEFETEEEFQEYIDRVQKENEQTTPPPNLDRDGIELLLKIAEEIDYFNQRLEVIYAQIKSLRKGVKNE